MKSLTVVVIVIAGLVGACSSEQQQSARDRSDRQVNLARLSPQIGPTVDPSNQQKVFTGMPLVGPCCQP